MDVLPAQMLPAVAHIVFGIFNLAVPNLIAWAAVVVILFLAVWMRIPNSFKPAPESEETRP